MLAHVLLAAVYSLVPAGALPLRTLPAKEAQHTPPATGSASRPTPSQQQEAPMHHAHGTFTVKVGPPTPGPAEGLTRFTMTKEIHGDLEGTSQGEMMGAGDYRKGHAGYVAVELVTGTLAGKTGSFALQHSATMNGADTDMSIRVSPGSGTDGLQGIMGTFTITIRDGQHFYDMDYTLPDGH